MTIQTTPDAVRDAIAALENKDSAGTVIGWEDICVRLIGSNPAHQKSASYGGKSKRFWFGTELSMASFDRAIDALIADNVIIEIAKPAYRAPLGDSRYVYFPGNTRKGYKLRTTFDALVTTAAAAARVDALARLREKAREAIADLHADEVDAEYRAQAAAAGIILAANE